MSLRNSLGVFVFSVRPSGALVCTGPTLGSESVSSTWGNCRMLRAQWTETPSTGPSFFFFLDFFFSFIHSVFSLFEPNYSENRNLPPMFCRWHTGLSSGSDVIIFSFIEDRRVPLFYVLDAVLRCDLVLVAFIGVIMLLSCCLILELILCCRCITGFVSLILKALQGRFVIPDFSTFTEETQKLFSRCRQLSSVQVSSALTLGVFSLCAQKS